MASSLRPWLAFLLIMGLFGVTQVVAETASGMDAVTTAEKRLALVVGSAVYDPKPLPTAANDAGLVAQALAQDGFDVTALADPDAATLRRAAETFADDVRRAGGKALVFVYLAGVGVQYGGVNYVVPAPAGIERQADIPEKAVSFSDLLRTLEAAPARARFFVYDLAHPTLLATSEPIPLASGLRHMQPSSGSLYAFNAAPGAVAPEAVPLFGTYARAWAEALRTPGLGLHALFSRVRLRVAEISAGADVPWDNGELDPDITLVPAVGPARGEVANRPLNGLPVQTVFWAALAEDTLAGYQAFLNAFPNDPLAARVRLMKAVRLEAANWAESCRANTPAAYWTYMRRYPRGPHYVDVRRRLAAVHAAFDPPMRFDVAELGGLPSPTADELRAVDRPGSPLTEVDVAAIPPPPDGLLPEPPSEIYVDLAPPPRAARGTLPVSVPIPNGSASGPARLVPGRIALLAGLDRLAVETGDVARGEPVMTLRSSEGMLATTTSTSEGHMRTILERDGAGKMLSRTTVRRTGDLLTVEQTGSDDRPLLKVVTRFSLNGDRETVVSDGVGRRVAEVHADKRSVMRAVTRGSGSIDVSSFALVAFPVGTRPSTLPNATAQPPRAPGPSESPRPSPPSAAAAPRVPRPPPLPPKNVLRIRPAEPGLSSHTPPPSDATRPLQSTLPP